jgi:hypothetical protein
MSTQSLKSSLLRPTQATSNRVTGSLKEFLDSSGLNWHNNKINCFKYNAKDGPEMAKFRLLKLMDRLGESLCKRIIHVFKSLQGFIAQKLGAVGAAFIQVSPISVGQD